MCARCGKSSTGIYCRKCYGIAMKENRKKWSLPGGREKRQKDDPMPPSSGVSQAIREILEETASRILKDARVLSGRKSLNTIDADPDAFAKALDQD